MLFISFLIGLCTWIAVFLIAHRRELVKRTLFASITAILVMGISFISLANILTDNPQPGASTITFDKKDICLDKGGHWVEETQACMIIPIEDPYYMAYTADSCWSAGGVWDNINNDCRIGALFPCNKDDACCEASVNAIRKGNFILADSNGECGSKYKKNMMKCPSSLQWCEPDFEGHAGNEVKK